MRDNSIKLVGIALLLITIGCAIILVPNFSFAVDPQEAAEEAALQKLLALQDELERIDARFRNRILVLLSAYMSGTWKEMDPRLLWHLAHQAAPDLAVLPEEWQRALDLGRETEAALRRAMAGEGGDEGRKSMNAPAAGR